MKEAIVFFALIFALAVATADAATTKQMEYDIRCVGTQAEESVECKKLGRVAYIRYLEGAIEEVVGSFYDGAKYRAEVWQTMHADGTLSIIVSIPHPNKELDQ